MMNSNGVLELLEDCVMVCLGEGIAYQRFHLCHRLYMSSIFHIRHRPFEYTYAAAGVNRADRSFIFGFRTFTIIEINLCLIWLWPTILITDTPIKKMINVFMVS